MDPQLDSNHNIIPEVVAEEEVVTDTAEGPEDTIPDLGPDPLEGVCKVEDTSRPGSPDSQSKFLYLELRLWNAINPNKADNSQNSMLVHRSRAPKVAFAFRGKHIRHPTGCRHGSICSHGGRNHQEAKVA